MYYEPTHNLESGTHDSAGVEGASSVDSLGGEMHAFMDQFRDQSADQFKGSSSCYNPAPASALQLADQPHNVMQQMHQHAADNAAGSAASDAAAAAAPESAEDGAQKQYQKFKNKMP